MYGVIDHMTFEVFFTVFSVEFSVFLSCLSFLTNYVYTVNKIFVTYFINKIIPIEKLIVIVYLFPIYSLEAGNSA